MTNQWTLNSGAKPNVALKISDRTVGKRGRLTFLFVRSDRTTTSLLNCQQALKQGSKTPLLLPLSSLGLSQSRIFSKKFIKPEQVTINWHIPSVPAQPRSHQRYFIPHHNLQLPVHLSLVKEPSGACSVRKNRKNLCRFSPTCGTARSTLLLKTEELGAGTRVKFWNFLSVTFYLSNVGTNFSSNTDPRALTVHLRLLRAALLISIWFPSTNFHRRSSTTSQQGLKYG